ncbi:MAG: MltA domain-containing protein [Planctomycetota bacterium]
MIGQGLRVGTVVTLLLGLMVSSGCKKAEMVPVAAAPDYARPLAPGAAALREVTDERRDRVLEEAAAQMGDSAFVEALGRSYDWFRIASTQQFFPLEWVTHARARASVEKLLELSESADARVRADRLDALFGVYESVGYDGSGVVLFTGYFSPEYTASPVRTGKFQYPLYTRPDDLVSDPATGAILGQRQPDGSIRAYPSRQQIEAGELLRGRELVYLPSRLDAFSIEVNGSAKLQLTTGGTMFVGYAGTNGREYTSIGRLLVADGVLDANTVTMPAIRNHFQQNPRQLDDYIRQNERFVFFEEYPASDWPAGSLGFRVTPERSLATDKKIFPRGGAVVVSTTLPDGQAFRQLMMDQDTGGAIRAPGRADLYFGIGANAERISGAQAAEGRLFYLFLKP